MKLLCSLKLTSKRFRSPAGVKKNRQTHQALIRPNEGIRIAKMTMSAGEREVRNVGMFVQLDLEPNPRHVNAPKALVRDVCE
jgi:hypothetical protein